VRTRNVRGIRHLLADADLIVAGAPVIAFRLPTDAMRQRILANERDAPTAPVGKQDWGERRRCREPRRRETAVPGDGGAGKAARLSVAVLTRSVSVAFDHVRAAQWPVMAHTARISSLLTLSVRCTTADRRRIDRIPPESRPPTGSITVR